MHALMMRAGRRASTVLVLGALACGASPRPADVVVFASGTDLESGNPLVTIHPLSRQVQRFALFTTLARYDSLLEPVPYLARAWSWSRDRRELTFSLDTTVSWHDGHATTANDVAFTLRMARNPKTGYIRAGDLAAIDTLIVRDGATITLRFSASQADFPLVLCELPIAPRHLLESVKPEDMRRAAFNLAPTGNGPFRFIERVAGQRWVFERNESFPDALGGPPKVKRLVIAVVDEPTTKFAGLASGDLDFAGISPTMAALASRDPTIRVEQYPILFSTALVLNVHRPPFDDVRVRRAIDLALDRDRIVNAALAGYGRPAGGPVVPESPLVLRREPVHDGKKADSLLDAAGWMRTADGERARGGKPFEVELLTVGAGDHALEQLIQADLAARGIRLAIRDVEFGAFISRARQRPVQFDMLVTGFSGDVSLAWLRAMYETRQRGSAIDYADFHSPVLDSLFAAARVAPASEAAAIWQRIQKVLVDEMPAVWVYHSRGVQGVSRRMQNVRMDLRGELASLTSWFASPATSAAR
jgi:peptide/nickel transport system substrate-binding protein